MWVSVLVFVASDLSSNPPLGLAFFLQPPISTSMRTRFSFCSAYKRQLVVCRPRLVPVEVCPSHSVFHYPHRNSSVVVGFYVVFRFLCFYDETGLTFLKLPPLKHPTKQLLLFCYIYFYRISNSITSFHTSSPRALLAGWLLLAPRADCVLYRSGYEYGFKGEERTFCGF